MQPNYMPWIDLLPEVGNPIRKERDKLAATLAEAEQLERRAAALRASVRAARPALMDRIIQRWTLRDIEQAANAAADRGRPFPVGYVQDAPLREALRALDGGGTPLEVLQAFHAGGVIRQHNLFSTATEEEQRATLHRVFDWWNYGAVPLLNRLEDEGRATNANTR